MSVAINLGSFTDIGDYNSLVSKLTTWLDRSDLAGQMQTFVGLIEPYLNRVLRTPEMETAAMPALASGGFALPSDCLAVRSVSIGGRALDAMSPGQMLGAYGGPGGIVNGLPLAYSVSGRQVTIAPTGTGSAVLTYWQRIPALTSAAPTNWLLTQHPDVYVYGALAQAEAYIDNPQKAAQWQALFEGVVAQIMEAAGKARFGGPIRARAMTQVCGTRA